MRIIKFLFIFSISILFFNSCTEDFNTAADFKDIPVVFGLLSAADTAHYIRVERAFLAPNQNAVEVAKNPDSIYYKNLDVKIVDLTDGRTYTAREVDGNLEGYVRQEGPFATEPNTLYKFSADDLELVPGREYRLEVNRGDDLPLVTSTTTVVNEVRLFSPLEGGNIRMTELAQVRISWDNPSTAYFFDVTMDFTFREINAVTGTNELKTISWPIVRRTTQDRVVFRGAEFIAFLGGSGLIESPAISRRIENIDITISAGGKEFYDFVQLILANSGVTSSQEVPEYSNLSEGRGLFSSRNSRTFTGFSLTTETIQDLNNNNLTSDLNFF